MTRTALLVRLVMLLALSPAGALYVAGCELGRVNITCPTRYHPGHLNEFGEPDPCCLSINPCCPNPFWGRKAPDSNGNFVNDLCCTFVACPGWDPWKGADAGEDGAAQEEPDEDTDPAGTRTRTPIRTRGLDRRPA